MNISKICTYGTNTLLGLALSFVSVAAFSEEIRVGGGAAPIENIFKKIQTPFEKASGNKLVLNASGPDQALIDLDQGKVDIATGGLNLEGFYELVAKKNYTLKNRDAFKARVIGRDRIQVYTHKQVNIKSLSKAELKDLFTGKIKNWKELKGPDLPIKIILGAKIPGTQKFFRENVMENQEFANGGATDASDAVDVQKKIANTPGAVGLGPISSDNESLNQPTIPVIGRPITAITKGIPSATVSKLFDFIRVEGEKLIEK
ncbi:MAG: substrate-binding domain-containing protein [Gallionellaceae bacterium]|jgi:phosphate transport system substrate-binding protein